MSLFENAGKRLIHNTVEEMSLKEYLTLCKKDPLAYATAAERLLHAVGTPELVDTRNDERLSRIFCNEKIPKFKEFARIFGLESTVKDIVSFVRHAAQGLEERKQILYLLGPVGSSKSSLVHIIKRLMERVPFYAIKGSPVFDNPLSLFSQEDAVELKIPERYFNSIPSPWLLKRLKEMKGDIAQIRVVRLFPSEAHQIALSHIEPGDENNQDISSLVGKLNIQNLNEFSQDDPDCYSFSGGLCLGNRGITEFAEMFKAPIKSLNPLLEATQSRFYKGTESISAIPYEGLIIAHSNESEWQKFRNDKRNEALIDRIFIVRVPYCLRYQEEMEIYKKMLKESSLALAPCAPKTLELLAKFSILSRLHQTNNGDLVTKMQVYNGENLKHKLSDVRSVNDYRAEAHETSISKDEGFFGISTRFAFKTLAQTFNFDPEEVAANPLHLLSILIDKVRSEHLSKEDETLYIHNIMLLRNEYRKYLDSEIKKAYIESYDEYGQNLFDRYFLYADNWLNDEDYRDPTTGLLMKTDELEKFLEEIETPAGISNKKDFRNEIVKFSLRYRAKNDGENPKWTAYQKIREVIEAKIFSNLEDMLPIISSSTQASADEKKRHQDFVDRMVEHGYTAKQVNVLIDWYIQGEKE